MLRKCLALAAAIAIGLPCSADAQQQPAQQRPAQAQQRPAQPQAAQPARPAAAPAQPAQTQPAAAAPAGAVASRYTLPLPQAAVVAGFDAAATPYGPGHRGVDLLSAQGATVRAAAAGVVSFAGPVAGRSLVVVQHPDGVRTTYEPVDPAVAEGAAVAQGQVLGAVAGTHGGRDDVLHWGARRADAYIDPLRLLRPLGVVRLVPFR